MSVNKQSQPGKKRSQSRNPDHENIPNVIKIQNKMILSSLFQNRFT